MDLKQVFIISFSLICQFFYGNLNAFTRKTGEAEEFEAITKDSELTVLIGVTKRPDNRVTGIR